MVSDQTVDQLAGLVGPVLVWIVLGVLLLWLVSMIGEQAAQKFKPAAPFLGFALMVGFLGLTALKG